MNKADLQKAYAAAEFTFYESIAKLIVDNPTVTLVDLRKRHGITHYQMGRKCSACAVSRVSSATLIVIRCIFADFQSQG